MFRLDRSTMKKNLILSSIGISLQLVGGICLLIATFGIVKNINLQIKKNIVEELSKQIEED